MSSRGQSCRLSFSPLGRWADVPAEQVRGALRAAWGRWGRPGWLKVDNGCPWVATGGLPTALELWAAGVDVRLLRIPPRRPQQNGVVERSQGTAKRWTTPSTCGNAEELQRRVDEEDRIQRQEYVLDDGQTRWQRHPGLLNSGRGYCLTWERWHWDLERVAEVLAEARVRRKVSRDGKVSLYDRGYWVGRDHRGKVVEVSLDPEDRNWVFTGASGEELKRHPSRELDQQILMALDVSRPRSVAGGRAGNDVTQGPKTT